MTDCIKLSELSRVTFYRIKASLISKENNSKPKIEKIEEPFDILYDESIDKGVFNMSLKTPFLV